MRGHGEDPLFSLPERTDTSNITGSSLVRLQIIETTIEKTDKESCVSGVKGRKSEACFDIASRYY